jgi:circadian clock protein KaiB
MTENEETKTEETKTENTRMLDVKDSTKAFEEALAEKGDGKYVLRLYVAGMSPK